MYFLTKAEIHSFGSNGNFSNTSSSTCNFMENTPAAKAFKLVVVTLIMLYSLAGNAIIVVTVYKRKEMRKTVNFFIVNMAISDLSQPIASIPFTLVALVWSSRQWPIGGFPGLIICKLKWYIQTVSYTVSVMSLVWIALDRFIAVVLPFKVYLISSKFRAFAIASTWIVSIILNSPDLVVNELVTIGNETLCTNVFSTTFPVDLYGTVRVVIIVAAPFVVMTVSYGAIGLSLCRSNKAIPPLAVHQKDKRRQQAIKMSFSIVAAFYMFNLPMPALLLLWKHHTPLTCSLYRELYFWFSVLFILSSTVSPTICLTFVQSYRRGFAEMFRRKKLKR